MRLTCPLCLTALPDAALSAGALPAPRDAEDPHHRDDQRRLDRALWAAIHALQEQASAAAMLLQLRPDASGATQRVAEELQDQVQTLHALLGCRTAV